MTKYNYKGAAALFDEYYNLCCDPWTLCEDERQRERRNFMYAITRGDSGIYVDYIKSLIEDARPVKDAKSRCFDFNYERELESLANKIWHFI